MKMYYLQSLELFLVNMAVCFPSERPWSVLGLCTCFTWHCCLLACLLANSILSAEPTAPVHFKTSPELSKMKLSILFLKHFLTPSFFLHDALFQLNGNAV